MQADNFEQPAFYSSWISPLQYLFAMRYLKHKSEVIKSFIQQGIYPVHKPEYTQQLKERLQKKSWFAWLKKPEFWFFPLSSIVFYPVLIAVLLFGSWRLHQWHIDKQMEQALADRMPYYSELLHRAQVTRQHQRFGLMEKFLKEARQERDTIISLVPDKGNVHQQLQIALDSLLDDRITNPEIMVFFKNLNTEMDKQKLPFYLSPKLFSVLCSSFAPTQKSDQSDMITTLERLFAGQKPDSNKPMCRTGIITVYNVTDRRALDFSDTSRTSEVEELPLFHVTRADRVPAADGALGLTFKSQGIGSIILLDQIKLSFPIGCRVITI